MIRFVTTNEGKFREVAALLASHDVQLGRLDASYPELQADSLDEVVLAGLEALRGEAGDILIDDSGLFVSALGGFPGVYSSHAYRTIGVDGLLHLMDPHDDRDARFETVIGVRLYGEIRTLRGVAAGAISREARGHQGFGFDPVFVPDGEERTFAEMDVDEKNRISHRGRAVAELARFLKER